MICYKQTTERSSETTVFFDKGVNLVQFELITSSSLSMAFWI